MHLVSCNSQLNTDQEEFAGDLAEVIELKLMGIGTIDGKAWEEYANELLTKYHAKSYGRSFDSKPLWRALYESYCCLDKSYSPNVVFMQLIKTLRKRLADDFPVEEISTNVLMDYLDKEVERAMIYD